MVSFFSLRRTAQALIAFAFLGCVLRAAADDPRPFRGRASEAVTGVELTPDGPRLTTDGSGYATHLGQFTRRAVATLYEDGTIKGTVVFVAANGDELYADIDGAFASATTIIGAYTITGGKGRFENASGQAAFAGVTSDGVNVALTFDGSIDY